MPVLFILFEEIFPAEIFFLIDLAITLHFLKDEVVASCLVIVIVGIKIPHHLISLKSFFLKLLEDRLFIEHVIESNYKALRLTDRFERVLEPAVVTYALWS